MDPKGSSQSQAGYYLVDEPGYYYIPVSGVYCVPGLRPVVNHGTLQQVRLRDLLYSLSVSDPPTFHGSSHQQDNIHPNPLIASGFKFMPDSDSPLNPNPLFGSGVPGSDRPAFRGSSQQKGISHLPNSNPPFGSGYNSVPGSDRPAFRGSSQQQGIPHKPLNPNPLFGSGYNPTDSNPPTLLHGSPQQQSIHNPPFGSDYDSITGSDLPVNLSPLFQSESDDSIPGSDPPLNPNLTFGSGYNSIPGSDRRPRLHGSSQQQGICHLPNPKPIFGSGYKSVPGSDPRRPGQAPGTSKPPIDEWIPSSTGKQYCKITISEGEDIVSKIKSVSQKCPNRIYVVSASGSVFNPILQPYSSHDSRGGIGKYDIKAMSISSYPALTDESFKLSVTLVGPQGQVISGTIGRSFIAATPVQVIVGSCISESEVPKIEQQQQEEEDKEEEEEDYTSYFSSEPPKSLYDA